MEAVLQCRIREEGGKMEAGLQCRIKRRKGRDGSSFTV